MNYLSSKMIKPFALIFAMIGLSYNLPAMASPDHDDYYHHHYGYHYDHDRCGGRCWVGAAVVTGLVAGLINNSHRTYYYNNPPVVYQYPNYPNYANPYPTYIPRSPAPTYVWDPYLGQYVIVYH